MTPFLHSSDWHIIEEGWDPARNRFCESIFSLGNGHMGLRGNFEEDYTGDTLQGSYIAGVYYPDPTRVGWWKNGYPDYFAKVLNATNWIGIRIQVDDEILDLHQAANVTCFTRILNMREGYLRRSFRVMLQNGKELEVETMRFCSIVRNQVGAIRYQVTPLNFSGRINCSVYLDGDVKNTDSNFVERFWDPLDQQSKEQEAFLLMVTRKSGFRVCTAMQFSLESAGQIVRPETKQVHREKFVACEFSLMASQGTPFTINKYGANLSSFDYPVQDLPELATREVRSAAEAGFDRLAEEQKSAWISKWEDMDILIEGDVAAQQGIRFNIFQLHQTYTGKDERLNISPKGFTGEKYGGCTYWDTEAYCLPFFLGTAGPRVARNLLLYRFNQLDKAIENARKLGFHGGAALFPMATINGEECHNEWEITFEEIHRNGAIAFGIRTFCLYTGDWTYLEDFGLEVLIAIARFWVQRVNWNEGKSCYMILGVTGPNEYENNVQNNWYTNTMAAWCLEFASQAAGQVKLAAPEKFEQLVRRLHFDSEQEMAAWKRISTSMYFPRDPRQDIFLQQDGYLDKEQLMAAEIPPEERPVHNHWSWDRILRSCLIKQADVLQGIYFFEEQFDTPTIARHFHFYEPRTLHESSLSPCVHSILAARIGDREKAYELYLRTARLDLDDYNADTAFGLHITSMAGTWMSIVQGFAGMRICPDGLYFRPFIPGNWRAYSFNLLFREWQLSVRVDQHRVQILNRGLTPIKLHIFEVDYEIGAGQELSTPVNPSAYGSKEKGFATRHRQK